MPKVRQICSISRCGITIRVVAVAVRHTAKTARMLIRHGLSVKNLQTLKRSLYCYVPFFQAAGPVVALHYRRIRRSPHQKHYGALAYISSTPDDLFLDVGANKGQSIESIRLFKPDNPIIAFEPNPKLVRQMRRRYASASNCKINLFGLGEAPGSFKLFIPKYRRAEYDARASLDKEEVTRVLNENWVYAFDPKNANVEEYQCEIRTLDSLNLKPFFIKLDVEGAEYSVLKGGVETIKENLPILLIESLNPEGPIMNLLGALSYQAYDFTAGQFRSGIVAGRDSLLVPESKKHLVRGLELTPPVQN